MQLRISLSNKSPAQSYTIHPWREQTRCPNAWGNLISIYILYCYGFYPIIRLFTTCNAFLFTALQSIAQKVIPVGEGCSDTTEVTPNLCQRREPRLGLSQQGPSIKHRLWMQFNKKNLMAEKGPMVSPVLQVPMRTAGQQKTPLVFSLLGAPLQFTGSSTAGADGQRTPSFAFGCPPSWRCRYQSSCANLNFLFTISIFQ